MKTVLITGSSSGYGRATAEHFIDQGWNVIATMRSPQKAPDFTKSERLRLVRLDVTDRCSIDEAIREGIGAFGELDVVVNNAGIGLFSAFEVTPEPVVRELFETNTFGVMSVCRAVIPYFRERRSGTFVNVTSSVGIAPMPLVAAYSASKWAIEGFTEALSYELTAVGLRAKIVEPGYGPTTRFIANSAGRMSGLVSAPYASYAEQLFQGFADAKSTDETDVARAVFVAANDESPRLRYPAGADSEALAAMRRAFPGDDYLEPMRAAVGPRA